MPVKKGTNNFLKDKTERINFIKEKIDSHLSYLRKSKASFENRSQVADYLCLRLTEDRIAEWKKKGCKTLKPKPMAKSTLYRNEEYVAKIDSFLANSPLQKGVDTSLAARTPHMSNAIISQQKAEISNLKNKIKMLELYIEKSGQEIAPDKHVEAIENSGRANDFAQTARALSLLIEASEGVFVLDNGRLLNATKMVGNVVADKVTMTPFVRWLESQGGDNG